jgi:hypothetical protein
MPLDPKAQFDHAIIEMIEHSPTGSVPLTPAYQDALTRLYAAHQVYANADHKDGHVTARSLSGLPGFRAGNLEALAAGSIEPEALEANANIFDNYVRSLRSELRARAESFRLTVAGRPAMHRAKHAGSEKLPVAHDLVHSLFLVPGAGPHPGLPGNYLYGFVMQVAADAAHGSWAVHLHDREDGSAEFRAPTMEAALAKLQELLESAPFTMAELEALGFRQT